MKAHLTLIKLVLALFIAMPFAAFAQYTGDGSVSTKTFETGKITSIQASGNFQVNVIQSDETGVFVETDQNLFDHIEVKEVNGVLTLSTQHVRSSTVLKATVTTASLQSVDASGASSISSSTNFQGDKISLKASGSGSLDFIVDVDELVTNLSGAAKLTIKGYAAHHKATLSGASKMQAGELKTAKTSVKGSGASEAKVWAEDALYLDTSGVAKVTYDKTPASLEKNEEIVSVNQGRSSRNGDTVSVNVGSIKVKVIENDSTKIIVGNRTIVVDDHGNVNVRRVKKTSFQWPLGRF